MTELGPAGRAYRDVRERVTALVSSVASTEATVPSCPQWRIHDLVSHCAGVVDDAIAGNMSEAGSEPWTAVQVDKRRDVPTADVLAEWNEKAPAVEAMLDSTGRAGHQLLMDVVTHELDLREALGADVDDVERSDAMRLGADWLLAGMTGLAAAAGRPSFRLRSTDGGEWSAGDAPVATLTASRRELLRACTGRRSEAQLRSMDWDGDVDAVLGAFTWGPFSVPPAP